MHEETGDVVNHVGLSQLVYQKVKALILNNVLAPGQKITQEEVARRLGVSRTPLLKALQMLESEMLVESIPRRGVFVKRMDLREIRDAFDCREALESIATRLAAEKITDAEVAEIRLLFAPFLAERDRIDLKQYEAADRRFHARIVEISGNRILANLEVLGNIQLIVYQRGLIRPPSETLPEHMAIIEALEKHDSETAEQLMRAHFKASRDRIDQMLRE
ncbi:MAG: GntR family transcriptional regulator [Candidatus Sumerlaeia bacterium]|nr:GntR family transcriptional regulator [Candidatus Sumerlaeia bacterium]